MRSLVRHGMRKTEFLYIFDISLPFKGRNLAMKGAFWCERQPSIDILGSPTRALSIEVVYIQFRNVDWCRQSTKLRKSKSKSSSQSFHGFFFFEWEEDKCAWEGLKFCFRFVTPSRCRSFRRLLQLSFWHRRGRRKNKKLHFAVERTQSISFQNIFHKFSFSVLMVSGVWNFRIPITIWL